MRNAQSIKRIHLESLRDPRRPVHKIADELLPYLQVLLEQFDPEQVILFGSFAHGEPTEHSDVDLLVLKRLKHSPIREGAAIRAAWRPILHSGAKLSFDLMVRDPDDLAARLAAGAPYYEEIIKNGLRLA
jgi:uncharacterized protein